MSVLVDGVIETVKHEIKKQESGFLGLLLETLNALMLGNMLTGNGFRRAGRGYKNMNRWDENF